VILLSSDTEGNANATTNTVGGLDGGKRKATTSASDSDSTRDANTRRCKDRQPNWNSPEVMALIHAKEEEHELTKLTTDSREKMDTAMTKWSRIAHDIGKAGFSNFYCGPIACKDKWQSLFGDYKKIKDYCSATGNNEDYFHMSSKRRKELTGDCTKDLYYFLSHIECRSVLEV
jgi:hypothetical protein